MEYDTLTQQYLRSCPTCDKTVRYKTEKAVKQADLKKSVCFSCRTARINKQRDVAKEKNPAWRGYKDIPGKVLSKLKRDAETRNISFNLTLEEIYNVFQAQGRVCAFTGIPLTFGLDASVDRINSDDGYYPDNIQIVHKVLNMMKKNMLNDDFIRWCCLVAEPKTKSD